MWQSTILISKQFNKEDVLKKGLERIEGLYFAEGEEDGYMSYDVASKEYDKDGCQTAVRELIADIILNNVKLQFILSSLGKRAIDTSLCTLISSMLYYENKKEEEFVRKQIAALKNYCVDGIVNFRLRDLVNEWKELGSIILNTIGKGFGEKEIYSLALYMLGERKDTSLFIADSREILITNVTQGGLVKVPEIYGDKIHNIINAIVKYGASEVVIERGNADKELLNALRNIVDVKIL
ncbi:MAG: hypothetical protein K2I78_02610 [Clostridia bacterium]|nr:hypothetical protein [Clostridia bacterium]MDE7216172.1 hypothetical protein [Clostridia bacterium]